MAGRKRKVGQHHGNLEQALIEAALELITAGEPSPSMRKIARTAGVSPAAPYHHFGSHEGLMVAVAKEGFESLTAALSSVEAAEDPKDHLRQITRQYVLFSFEHRAHYLTMFQPSLPDAPDELDAAARESFSLLVRAIMRASSTTDMEANTRLARQTWALVHGAVLLGFDEMFAGMGGPTDPEGIADEVSSSIVAMATGSPG